jgi:hypothetical protein
MGGIAAVGAAPVSSFAAESMTIFAESGGCKVRSSETSAQRMREVASQGSVTWDGKCRNGFIDGAGVLRHQGEVVENGRTRRYAFYLTGTARDGVRAGQWKRETFNMFADSMRYWTSLATIQYADGISRGAPKLLEVRSNADFSPAFREFLATVDRELALRERPAGSNSTIGRVDGSQGVAMAPEIGLRAESELSPSPAQRPAAAAAAPPVASAPAAPSAPAAANTPFLTTAPAVVPLPPAQIKPAPAATVPGPAPAVATTRPAPPVETAAARPAPPAAEPFRPIAAEPAPERNMQAYSGGLKPRIAGIGLSPWETPRPAPPPPPPRVLEQLAGCSLDTVNGNAVGQEPLRFPKGSTLRVAGWAADPRFNNVPPQAWLHMSSTQVTDSITIDILRNVERPDVAKALGAQVYAKSGFDLPLEARKLPAGDYTVSIIQVVAGEVLVCKSMARVSLR